MKSILLTAWVLVGGLLLGVQAAEKGDSVLVVYNSRVPSSRQVAEHYAKRRSVPDDQVVGLKLPDTETMTRAEYVEQLEQPLARLLEKRQWWQWSPADGGHRVTSAKIRYVVLCYGVPVKILPDPTIDEPSVPNMPSELHRNEAAVDSELASLPWVFNSHRRLFGYLPNPAYGTTDTAALDPTRGVVMVTRLDGPTAEIALHLVDKAMEAEENGLWGRAYIDLRNIKDGPYKEGEDWIAGAGQVAKAAGFETVIDERPETFSAGFPLSQVALYAGWYDGDVSGPFARSTVEFMPGAIAYHLHSFSAYILRSPAKNWSGPLLAKGVTATMGSVEEPYLSGTPQIGIVFERLLLRKFTFGEAAYAGSLTLSWMTTMIGDPLYCPAAIPPMELHQDLVRRGSPLVSWSILRAANLRLQRGNPPKNVIDFLNLQYATAESSVLLEKVGDLNAGLGLHNSALEAYAQALRKEPTPQQRVRLRLSSIREQLAAGHVEEALRSYQALRREFPEHPDLDAWRQAAQELVERLRSSTKASESH